jgi:hypothetical protein
MSDVDHNHVSIILQNYKIRGQEHVKDISAFKHTLKGDIGVHGI